MSRELQALNQQNNMALLAEHIANCGNSKQSVKTWCRENGICDTAARSSGCGALSLSESFSRNGSLIFTAKGRYHPSSGDDTCLFIFYKNSNFAPYFSLKTCLKAIQIKEFCNLSRQISQEFHDQGANILLQCIKSL